MKDLIENCRDELVNAPYIQSEQEIVRNIDLANSSNNVMIEILERLENIAIKSNHK